jgi:hypothetical protein
MIKLFITILVFFPVLVMADVRVFELDENTNAPVNIAGDHYAQKCDSQRTKRRAHQLGFMSDQKRLDINMQTACYDVCKDLASGESTVSCIRECNDQQREQRKEGWERGNSLINGLSPLFLLLKAL